ncbi:MAG TPA: Crp/Fnr family transcriptional regulator [Polyangia bacterium]|nr:Crp/Fnr family transcriptional regulator [Polyangia bacterium]
MFSSAQRPTPTLDDPKLERYRSVVAQSVIFRGCTPQALDDLVRRMQIRTRPAGTIIVAQDEPGDAMFVLAQGRVKVALFGESGRELTLSELKPGDFFGEMSLLDSRPRSANVVAIDDATVLALTREAFAAHLKAHPQTAMNMLGELARRLRRADETIANLALHDVESRLTRTLERLAREDGESTEAGLLIRRRPTQQDLANMVGSCRETISRTFTSMIKRGLLVPRGRALVLTRALLDKQPHAVPA